MEENLNILKEASQTEAGDVREYSPLTLAYMGDAVYELLIRTKVVTHGNAPVNKLNKKATPYRELLFWSLWPDSNRRPVVVGKENIN